MTRRLAAAASLATLALAAFSASASTAPEPPRAPRKDHAQVFHGQTFVDPYHWLREKDTPDVLKYLADENAYTEAMTADLQPFREALYAELLGRIKQTDLSVPTRIGGYYYYSRTVEGLQYPIRCRKAKAADGSYRDDAPEQVLLDQNEMAKGKPFLSVRAFVVSDDESRLAFSTDETGFRQFKLFVKDLGTGEVRGPLAERVTSVVWAADNRTLFFVTGGSPQAVYKEKDEQYSTWIARTKDRRYLVLSNAATDTWEQRLLRAEDPRGTFRVVLPREKSTTSSTATARSTSGPTRTRRTSAS
jgi:oligopeptidase B